MAKILHFAWRNLLRYRRRTLLTGSLIALSVVAVLLFVSLSGCLLYTSPSPRDRTRSRMPSSA